MRLASCSIPDLRTHCLYRELRASNRGFDVACARLYARRLQRDVLMVNRGGGDGIQPLAGHWWTWFEQPLHFGLVDDYFHHGDHPARKRGNGLCAALLNGQRKGPVQRLHLHRSSPSRHARDHDLSNGGQHAWNFQREVHVDSGHGGDPVQPLAGPRRAGFEQPRHFGLVDNYFHHGDEPRSAKGATVYARLYSMVSGKVEYNDYTYTEAA